MKLYAIKLYAIKLYAIPANTKHSYNICTMLDQRRRRWVYAVQMLCKCLVVAGIVANSRVRSPLWLSGFKETNVSSLLARKDSVLSRETAKAWILNRVSEGWCHLILLIILRKFSLPCLACRWPECLFMLLLIIFWISIILKWFCASSLWKINIQVSFQTAWISTRLIICSVSVFLALFPFFRWYSGPDQAIYT